VAPGSYEDYDRAVQLGRTRMNDLMLDMRLPTNASVRRCGRPREASLAMPPGGRGGFAAAAVQSRLGSP